MTQIPSTGRPPGATYAISDTGPLISAFQSDSFTLLMKIFAEIFISTTCRTELEEHGWEEEIQLASPHVITVKLTPDEDQRVLTFARQIAQYPGTHDPVVKSHIGEAEAIVLALRPEYQNDLLLLDELAARSVAAQMGMKLSGFPGALLLAAQSDLISVEELKVKLEMCREQGTHYGKTFIRKVYDMAKQLRRE